MARRKKPEPEEVIVLPPAKARGCKTTAEVPKTRRPRRLKLRKRKRLPPFEPKRRRRKKLTPEELGLTSDPPEPYVHPTWTTYSRREYNEGVDARRRKQARAERILRKLRAWAKREARKRE